MRARAHTRKKRCATVECTYMYKHIQFVYNYTLTSTAIHMHSISCLNMIEGGWQVHPYGLSECLYMFLMRDEKEERKKQARSNKQTRQSNTAHPRQSLFLEKMSCFRWDSNPRHTLYSRQSALPTELPRHVHV